MWRGLLALTGMLAMLGGCVTVDYSSLEPGTFSGRLFVMWVDEGGPSGDGTFLFVPDPRAPLTFRRHDAQGTATVIRPGLMYTDGGSIPKIAQVFKGLSPWGYAPAYMIHDWLFVGHHCIVDGEDDGRFAGLHGVTFDESAKILGEAIRGLVAARQVQPNDLAGSAITSAVDSFVARNLWNVHGACASSHVRPEDVAAAEAAIPGSTRMAIRRGFRLPAGTPRMKARTTASIVARISF